MTNKFRVVFPLGRRKGGCISKECTATSDPNETGSVLLIKLGVKDLVSIMSLLHNWSNKIIHLSKENGRNITPKHLIKNK